MRDQIIDFLRRELVGPDPVPGATQENGEEILTGDPPRLRYSAGVLFPRELTADASADVAPAEVAEASAQPAEGEAPEAKGAVVRQRAHGISEVESQDDTITLAN